ncbi:acetoin dehydrogenase dihydrolipoyllysine-residue acetyltransferase subunit [Paraburkholderia humisilvae]|uniref:2-succinyl-6-hydroxy-2, 4-cyclohexadiene-1-carboxylate synthase n=1 Tax=Paraburkholderia humisilvae TaxID=627669 RepID=A0A6J5E8A5_9BURK|nr:acetoin dehydrogenase dihydrolipoyllysine-residue acetyltransferase subunit [Paraburkholderia humisilvae]CAB3762613.1 2-succinyl-6-hydroxy-2, 4-cyclohexadiene-1-carboxylate synthase [Paraburkholderia humisilvae]
MPTEVILPRVDMDMTEGMIAAWHVHEGDTVRAGAVIFEIETSKATMEVDAPASGVIRHLRTAIGESMPVGTPVAWIYADGEAVADLAVVNETGPAAGGETQAAVAGEDVTRPTPASVEFAPASAPFGTGGRLRATPAARRLARERSVRLEGVAGTGPHGRIVATDVLREPASAFASISAVRPNVAVPTAAAPLHYVWLREGTGDPLVLLHGFAAELNSWRPFCHALGRAAPSTRGVLALDLPAHGKSSAQRAGSIDAIVEAVDATLAAQGVTCCHLAGHSFGGAIALAAAAQGPLAQTKIRSLTLIAPAGLGPDSNAAFMRGITQASRRASFAAWLKELFADPSQLDDVFVATAEQQLADAEVRARLAALADTFFPDGAQSLDLRGVLAALTVPVRVIWGLQDRILPARHAEGLPGRVAVHRFARVGHLPQLEARDEVAVIVAQNIASAG